MPTSRRAKNPKKPRKPKTDELKRKRGRPKKGEERPPKPPRRLKRQRGMTLAEMLADLPKPCDVGTKRNAKGYWQSWTGYKLHIDTGDGDIPISCGSHRLHCTTAKPRSRWQP